MLLKGPEGNLPLGLRDKKCVSFLVLSALAAYILFSQSHLLQPLRLACGDAAATTPVSVESAPNRSSPGTALHHLARMASAARSNLLDDAALPYRCGVVFFFHIGCTGGTSINDHLVQYSKQGEKRNLTYFTFWGIPAVETKFIEGMNDLVQNISSDEWRISQAHHNSLRLNESEPLLVGWRSAVESQGCHFVAAVMFRDPISHALAKHRYLPRVNESRVDESRAEWLGHLRAPSGTGLWETNLDYFLYNKLERNPHNRTSAAKVRRALDLLVRHFDVVAVGGHGDFVRRIRQITGWEEKGMPHSNSNGGRLDFTKKEVENIQKLLKQNGDIEFMEKVKLIYGQELFPKA